MRRPLRRLPFPLEEPTCRVVAWARHGVWHGVRALGLQAGDAVLVPAWHHGSEVEALRQAGLDCRFYDSGPSLEPDPAEIDALVDSDVRALYLTHSLGFPRDARRWRAWCDARGLLLIEDAAQAWLATRDGHPAGSLGDLAVFCLYKTFGLAEGAALVSASPPAPVGLDPRLGMAPLARQHGMCSPGARISRTQPRRRFATPGPTSRRSTSPCAIPTAPPGGSHRSSCAGSATRRWLNDGATTTGFWSLVSESTCPSHSAT